MAVVAGVLGRAGGKGEKRRLQDASRGSVSWNTPPELTRHMKKEVQAAILKRKEVMGRMQSNIQGFTEDEQNLLRSQYKGVELDVSEDEMVEMMGATALGEAGDASSRPAQASGAEMDSRLGDIEAQLQSVGEQATHIETVVGESAKTA